MPSWDDAAQWYLAMAGDAQRGFNDLAARTALSLLGDVSGQRVLDVGCGEGHVTRELARRGAQVTGVEPAPVLLAAARSAEGRARTGARYLAGRAEHLAALADACMDAVCAVLVLHHVGELTAALRESRRVLRPGGALVVVLPHPWTDHPGARWTGAAEAAAIASPAVKHRVIGDYAREGFWCSGRAELTSIRDLGWHHRTLSTWAAELSGAGFRLDALVEPLGGESGRDDGGGPWAALPRFLAFRAIRHEY